VDYTISTTPDQDALLEWIVKQHNLERDSSLTVGDYISLRFPQLLAPYKAGFLATVQKTVSESFSKADPAVQAQVRVLLGLK
jgi:hypothetical protein